MAKAKLTTFAVGFGKGEWLEKFDPQTGKAYDFAFKPVINEFRGHKKVELHLIDFRPSI